MVKPQHYDFDDIIEVELNPLQESNNDDAPSPARPGKPNVHYGFEDIIEVELAALEIFKE
jgi:hypothetical protein